jgi:hypothetical protein
MKIIAIGDVHHHIKAAETIASKYENTHKIVFTGDYFDDFGDNAHVSQKTALWLKESINKPNRVHLIGNHDLSYTTFCESLHNGRVVKMYPCSGYSDAKNDAITEILGIKEWERVKLHHFENEWHFTHAGMHPNWFDHEDEPMNNESILEKIKRVHEDFYNSKENPIVGHAGWCRGGPYPAGGITWHDHQREAKPSKGVLQVYGHTPCSILGHSPRFTGIDIYQDNGGVNIDIDCGLSQVLEIDEHGAWTILDTGFDNFYRKKQNKNNFWNS